MVMQIKQLYEQYQIMPQLATHMLRVAGIGKLIATHWKTAIDQDLVLQLCLLHDMGNILKFKDFSPESERAYGYSNGEYWHQAQQAFAVRYGWDVGVATQAVIDELDLPTVSQLFHEYGSYPTYSDLLRSNSNELKIMHYADSRVTPVGVVTLSQRIDDLVTRYHKDIAQFEYLFQLETELQNETTIDFASINEVSVESFFDELRQYSL